MSAPRINATLERVIADLRKTDERNAVRYMLAECPAARRIIQNNARGEFAFGVRGFLEMRAQYGSASFWKCEAARAIVIHRKNRAALDGRDPGDYWLERAAFCRRKAALFGRPTP